MRPELMPRLRVVGAEPAPRVGDEDEVTAGRQHTGQLRLEELHLPLLLPGDWISSGDMTMRLAALRIAQGEVGADVELRLRLQDRRGLDDFEIHAPFLADLVVEA